MNLFVGVFFVVGLVSFFGWFWFGFLKLFSFLLICLVGGVFVGGGFFGWLVCLGFFFLDKPRLLIHV